MIVPDNSKGLYMKKNKKFKKLIIDGAVLIVYSFLILLFN